MNAAAPFLDILAADPSRSAVVEPGGRRVHYGELLRRTIALARHLQRQGLQSGDVAVLQLPNGPEFAASALAVLLCGGVPVLIEPGMGTEVYRARVRAAGARWWLVHPLLAGLHLVPGAAHALARREVELPPPLWTEGGVRPVVVGPEWLARRGRRSGSPAGFLPVEVAPHADGVLVFTGGTTSAPKGVRLSHRALGHYLANIGGAIADVPLDNFLADTPQQVLYALRLGRTAYVTRGQTRKRARTVLDWVLSGRIDAYFGSPFVWTEMMQFPDRPERLPRTLKTVLLGGAPVTPDFLDRLLGWLHPDTQVRILYGMTEVGPVCAVDATVKLAYRGQGDLVGPPLPGVTTRLAETDRDYPEIMVHSPSLYTGYLGRPPRSPEAPLATGDLGTEVLVDGARMVALMGRAKDMIIRRGVNIYPLSYEPGIRAMTGPDGERLVRECALVGVWNETRQDEDVALAYQPLRPQHFDESAFRRKVAVYCGDGAAPDRYQAVAEMPVTGRQNKVDKGALRRLVDRPAGGDGGVVGAVVPYDWRAFVEKHRVLFRDHGGVRAVAGPAAFRLGLWAANQATWALDEMLEPSWRQTSMAPPLFIVGHQRSGTTLLHRLLATDKTHARAMPFQEMLLPALSAQRTLSGVANWDRRLGGHLGRAFRGFEERAFGPLDDIHRLRFGEIEEDEFVLWTIYASAMCVNDSPVTTGEGALAALRQVTDWPSRRRQRALAWYRACVTKAVRLREVPPDGEPPWYVSKNPAFSQRIPELAAAFPGARFVHLVRHPLETIPSRLSLIRAIWRHRFPDFHEMTPAQVSAIVEDSIRTYLLAHRDLPTLPPSRRLTIRYEELTADPAATVRRLYRHFGLPGPDEHLERALQAQRTAQRGHRSHHHYDLAEFGLDADDLATRLAPVLQEVWGR